MGITLRLAPLKALCRVEKLPQLMLKNKAFLLQSEKDIAELTMITDLKRHDFKKICKSGSISVQSYVVLKPIRKCFMGSLRLRVHCWIMSRYHSYSRLFFRVGLSQAPQKLGQWN